MIKKPWLFIFMALFLGWAFDFLFWGHTPGVSFAVYTGLYLVTGFTVLITSGKRPAKNSLLLLAPIIFFATMFTMRLEPLSLALSIILTIFSAALLAVTWLKGNWLKFDVIDYAVNFLRMLASLLTQGMVYIANLINLRRKNLKERPAGRLQLLFSLGRGLLIAFPIVVFFTMLLASADLVFASKIEATADFFRKIHFSEYVFRFIYVLYLAYFIAGVFLYAAGRGRDKKPGARKEIITPFIGFTETVVVLGSIITLFSIFVAIQFQYFFGGPENIGIEGYTYAEYARRGFGELLAVAIFCLIILLCLSMFCRRVQVRQQRVFSWLGAGMVVLVLVMLTSAFQRLTLYEEAYGFSRHRTYTHVFMIWLGLLLVALVVMEIIRRQRLFTLVAVLAAFGFAVSINLLNVDGFVARYNIQRSLDDGRELDTAYLKSLSNDAVPSIADAFRSESTPEPVRSQLAAVLADFDLRLDEPDEDDSWRSFNLSRWHAERELRSLEAELEPYAAAPL